MPESKKSKPNDEVRRLVREEMEAALLPLRKNVAELEKQIACLKKSAAGTKKKADVPAMEKALRVKPAEIVKLRKKWKLNRALFGDLFGVSIEEVKSWERGEHTPAPKAVELIFHIRDMSKKERRALVESVAAELEEAIPAEPAENLK